jgi:hypothetical protein
MIDVIRNIRSKFTPPLSPEIKALLIKTYQETIEFENMRDGWASPLSKIKRSEKRMRLIAVVMFMVLIVVPIATIWWADVRHPVCPSNMTPRNWHGQCRFVGPLPFPPVSKP